MNKSLISKFESFLDNLKGCGQDILIENVKKGFISCVESDVPPYEEHLTPYAKEQIMKENPNSEEIENEIGNTIIKVLGLKVKENGRVDTYIGDKTPVGLTRTIKRIISEGGINI